MIVSLYLRQESTDFNEIWRADAKLTKYQNFPHSKQRTAAILKIFLAIIISTFYCPINAKLGKMKQTHTETQVT